MNLTKIEEKFIEKVIKANPDKLNKNQIEKIRKSLGFACFKFNEERKILENIFLKGADKYIKKYLEIMKVNKIVKK